MISEFTKNTDDDSDTNEERKNHKNMYLNKWNGIATFKKNYCNFNQEAAVTVSAKCFQAIQYQSAILN